MVSGVCGGIAQYFEIDPTLVRMAAVILMIVTFGTVVIAYVVMAIVVPEEPAAAEGSAVLMSQAPGASAPPPPPPPPASAPPSTSPPPQPPEPIAPGEARHRPGRGGIVFGVVLVLLGFALLLSQFVPGRRHLATLAAPHHRGRHPRDVPRQE